MSVADCVVRFGLLSGSDGAAGAGMGPGHPIYALATPSCMAWAVSLIHGATARGT